MSGKISNKTIEYVHSDKTNYIWLDMPSARVLSVKNLTQTVYMLISILSKKLCTFIVLVNKNQWLKKCKDMLSWNKCLLRVLQKKIKSIINRLILGNCN